MNNSSKTRKAFLASVMTLALCFVMLIGTTFAWFTDTATTGVNKIQAGELKIELQMKDSRGNWVSAEGQTLNFVKAAEAPETEPILWEPGCTYKLQDLRLVNNSNLALKYKVVITGIKGDAELNEAIDWTIKFGDAELAVGTEMQWLPSESTEKAFTISGHMKETAGNEYQGLSIDGIAITVYATQLNSEFDSINNTYDTDATYLNKDADGNWLISNADELIYFARTVNVEGTSYAGKTVKLTNDIDLNNKYWTPINTGNWGMTFDGNGKTISNLKTAGEKNVGLFGLFTGNTAKNLTIDGANVVGINHVAAIAGDGLCAHFENCIVKNATITTAVKNSDDGDKAGAICGYLSAEPNASVTGCTVENVTVKGYRDIGGLVGYAGGEYKVTGNKLSNVRVICEYTENYKNYTDKNEYHINQVIGEQGTSGECSGNDCTNVTVTSTTYVADTEELSDSITSATPGDTIVLTSGNFDLLDTKSGVTISGNGADTVLNIPADRNKKGLTIDEDKVVIKNATIIGDNEIKQDQYASVLRVESNNMTLDNVTMPNNTRSSTIIVGNGVGIGDTFTVSNSVLTGGFKCIHLVDGFKGTMIVDNCDIDATYPFNVNSASSQEAIIKVKNSILHGWTSYSAISSVSFEDTKFEMGSSGYNFLRPYCETSLKNCSFDSTFKIGAGKSGINITLDNCYANGVLVTAENFANIAEDIGNMKACNVTVNGVQVS